MHGLARRQLDRVPANAEKNEQRQPISSVDDIHPFADDLLTAAQRYAEVAEKGTSSVDGAVIPDPSSPIRVKGVAYRLRAQRRILDHSAPRPGEQ